MLRPVLTAQIALVDVLTSFAGVSAGMVTMHGFDQGC